jgi:hypothetical protein
MIGRDETCAGARPVSANSMKAADSQFFACLVKAGRLFFSAALRCLTYATTRRHASQLHHCAPRARNLVPSAGTMFAGAVDLKVLSFIRHPRHKNFKSKTAPQIKYL